jgi:hypothetical protein
MGSPFKRPLSRGKISPTREKRGGGMFSFPWLFFLRGRREVDCLSVDLRKAHEGGPSRGFFPLVPLGLKIRVAMGAVERDGEPEEIGITVELLSTLWAFHINNIHGSFLT